MTGQQSFEKGALGYQNWRILTRAKDFSKFLKYDKYEQLLFYKTEKYPTPWRVCKSFPRRWTDSINSEERSETQIGEREQNSSFFQGVGGGGGAN